MVQYQITAVVDPDLVDRYETYMRTRHMPDVIATGYFVSATLSRSGNRYRAVYDALSQEVLDEYLQKSAPEMRADFTQNFSDGVELTREHWEVIERFPAA